MLSCDLGLLSEDQCRAREVRRKTRNAAQSKRNVSKVGSASCPDSSDAKPPSPVDAASANPLDQVSPDTREVIRKLVYYQDFYELPNAEDIDRVQVCFVQCLMLACVCFADCILLITVANQLYL